MKKIIPFLLIPLLFSASANAQTLGYGTTTPKTLTNGQAASNSYDLSNNLRVIGTLTPSGTEDVNLKQVGGASVQTGHGTAAGAVRVELPTDGTGAVGLNAGTNVIGHVINDTGSTTAVTGNVTVVQPTGTNLHAVLDTTSTTAVTQATGTNLHAVIDSGSTTAVTQATGTNLHAVIDSGSTTAVTQATASNLNAQVQGAGASGATTVGNPLLMGVANSTNTLNLLGTPAGRLTTTIGGAAGTGADGTANTLILNPTSNADTSMTSGLVTNLKLFNGSTYDRAVSAGVGNAVAATGIAAHVGYGEFLTNANQMALTTGQYGALQTDPAGNLHVGPPNTPSGSVLCGTVAQTSTTSATTIVTVAAGKTWVGTISASVDVGEAAAGTAAGQSLVTITTAGTNVTPAAGTYLDCEARAGANAATGTVGSQGANFCTLPFTVIAPAGNTVTIQGASIQAGTNSRASMMACGNYVN